MAKPLGLDDLLLRLAEAAAPRRHFVSHQTNNLDALLQGMSARDYGMSFARAPHERTPAPLPENLGGRPGVVYATVGGPGVDYSARRVRDLIDEANARLIDEAGSNAGIIPALRDSGVGWVNNWNSIGAADELHVLDPRAVDIRRVFELPVDRSYRFQRPLDPMPPARAYGLDDYSQPIQAVRR